MMTRTMTKCCVAFVLAVGVASSALGQQGNAPPQFAGITYQLLRNIGGSPFGPYAPPVAFDPTTQNAVELDVIRITMTITDPDFIGMMGQGGGEGVFVLIQMSWFPVPGYPNPEPPPVPEASMDFQPMEGDGIAPPPGMTMVTIVRDITIPEFLGKNQARLRGDVPDLFRVVVNYDVRWFLTLAISNEQNPDCTFADTGDLTGCMNPVSLANNIIYAVESPLLSAPNAQPFADAGADQTIQVGTTARLDGSRTFDSFNLGFSAQDPNVFERDTLSFTWEWISGPERVDPIIREPLIAPSIAEVTLNTVGTYIYRLTVDDGVNPLPTQDEVTITVVSAIPPNRAPIARINGPSASVVVGSIITLDGTSSSDPDGDPLVFRWRQTDELGGNLSPTDVTRLFQPINGLQSPISTWQAVTPGTYYVRLLVSDGRLENSTRFSIRVINAGTAGATVERNGASGATAEERGAENAPILSAPAACGAGLLPLAVLPVCLWLSRGRRW